MPTPCTLCGNVRRGEIDAAIHARTSFRGVAAAFGLKKDSVARHARAHCGIGVADAKTVTNGRRRAVRSVASSANVELAALKPIGSPEDVVEDLQRLRIESFALCEQAKARADWKSAERIFSQVVAVVDRFGEMHRVLGSKGVNVTIDRSTQQVNVLASLSNAQPDALIARSEAGETIVLSESIEGEVVDG